MVVGRPDVKGREEILKVHARNKPLGDDVDLKQIAQTTSGFTGADLENLLNEAAILAAKENRVYIQQSDIRHAFVKSGSDRRKRAVWFLKKERRITAYHEAGHAILFHVLPDVGPVYSVSIVPTGGAGGYTMPLPEGDDMFNTKGHMLQEITVSLGGRVAEEQIFDDITTGASQDIRQATAIAKSMITKFGMSERLGLINYDNDSDEVFIGRDFGHTSRGYGEKVAGTIDEEVKRIIDECYLKAKAILEEHQSVLEACAQLLLEKKRLQEVSLKHFLRSRCRMGKLFLMPGRHFKGLAPKEVYMNKNALFCDGTSDYVIPAEPGIHEKVRLRFRTARDDAQESV